MVDAGLRNLILMVLGLIALVWFLNPFTTGRAAKRCETEAMEIAYEIGRSKGWLKPSNSSFFPQSHSNIDIHLDIESHGTHYATANIHYQDEQGLTLCQSVKYHWQNGEKRGYSLTRVQTCP